MIHPIRSYAENVISIFVLSSLVVIDSLQGTAQSQLAASGSAQTPSSAVVESGKFRFYETRQPRGEETYELTRSSKGEFDVTVKTALPFAEQDTKPQVSATLRASADLTPQAF